MASTRQFRLSRLNIFLFDFRQAQRFGAVSKITFTVSRSETFTFSQSVLLWNGRE
jgi:hypothetical protein